MKFYFSRTLLATLLAVSLSACTTIRTAGDWVNDNPLFADLATRQAVARLIDQGETREEKARRAVEVKTVIERTMVYLEGNPQVTASGIVSAIESNIAWDRLNAADQMLVRDILLLVQIELAGEMVEKQIPNGTVLAVNSLLRTAISAASLFQ